MSALRLADIGRQVAFERLAIALGADSRVMDEERLIEEAAARIARIGELPHGIAAGLRRLADAADTAFTKPYERLLDRAADRLGELDEEMYERLGELDELKERRRAGDAAKERLHDAVAQATTLVDTRRAVAEYLGGLSLPEAREEARRQLDDRRTRGEER